MNKKVIFSSLFWKFAERIGTKGVDFLVQLVLARLLFPEQYGMIALAAVFLQLVSVFKDSGFNSALIQKKNADLLDFSSVFYLTLVFSLFLYGVLFFIAPLIASFYKISDLTLVLRVLGLKLIISSLISIQSAYIVKNFLFKKMFYSSILSSLFSGGVGIFLAYQGYGVWALVVQQMVSQIIVGVVWWFLVNWRPALLFSFNRLKGLFNYGSKILASALLNTFYENLQSLIIGKVFNPAMLGIYNQGKKYPEAITTNIDSSIQSVLFPALVLHQDNQIKLKEMMRRAMTTTSFIIFPLMVGLAMIANPLVKEVLTDKWIDIVPFLQIFSFIYIFYSLNVANLQAIKAFGRSDIFLKLEAIKKILGLIILTVTIPFGVLAMAWGQLVSGVIFSFINAYPNKKLLNYSYGQQIKDLAPTFLISVVMGGAVFCWGFLKLSPLLTLILQVVSGGVFYFALAKIFKVESLAYLIKILKQVINKKHNVV